MGIALDNGLILLGFRARNKDELYLVSRDTREMSEDFCDFCKGSGMLGSNLCVFCNGTGEWNQAAQAYLKNHICQCIVLDRKFCPVCNKPCHHDTSLNPKQKIDPGHGGMSSRESNKIQPEIVIV